jgi:site-specific recombinase XerD
MQPVKAVSDGIDACLRECSGGQPSFSDYLAEILGRSRRTVEAYCRDVSAFMRYCSAEGLEIAPALSRPQGGLYLMRRTEERRRGAGEASRLGSRSAARAASALKAYARYLEFCGVGGVSQDIAQLAAPKYGRKLPAYFNVDELRSLVGAFDGQDDAIGCRNAAVLALLYGAGLRVSECAGLRIGDVDLQARLVTVLGKGGKQRTVPFGTRVVAALEAYLEQRAGLSADRKGAQDASTATLWLSSRGNALSARGIQRVVDQAALLAGQIKPVSPHKLRHACATHMLEGGADVRLLQELLGHSSIDTTQVYTQVTRRQLLESYEKTHPRAAK